MEKRYLLAGMAMLVTLQLSDIAGAAGIETLVMPGKVIEGHAETEEECAACHVKFERGRQRDLCMACHEDIQKDLSGEAGFHGRSPEIAAATCASCHTEHEGRDADIVGLDEQTFDHGLTDFALGGKHAETECDACHEAGKKRREAPSDCIACHKEDNVHGDTMGDACGDCHNDVSWEDVEFDHDSTGYALLGKHIETACLDCHADQTFQQTPTTCFGCHEKDDAHDGKSGTECGNCHNPTSWTDTSFNHNRDTDFPLEFRHAELTCGDCHSEDPFSDELETACVSCHLEDDKHEGHFGAECESCHGTEAWATIRFDHDVDTDYVLNGAHETLECEACHVEPIFDVPLLGGCNDCHAEDDPHDGEQGTACDDCHNEISWQDKVFFDHDLTTFPLLGAHAETECDGCHESHVFKDAPERCIDCHADDDPHDGRYSDACADCHNPVSWEEWLFDHNTQTTFLLEGAHVDVACDNCHRQPLAAMSRLGARCGDCHRSDDIHDGEFGFDCERCHTADSFREVRSIR